jgi:O-antigen ligase
LFAPEDLWFTAHAHGLYFNTLAERGLVGLLPLLIFLAGIGLTLFRHRMQNTDSPLQKTLWGGALGAWVVTVLGGLFNTTFHHEHGLITMILIAIWLAQLRPGVSDKSP